MQKVIPLGDVLSVTTGVLVSRDHISGVYNVCDWMSGVNHMIYELPRAADVAKPAILKQHPELANIEKPHFEFPEHASEDGRMQIVFGWLEEQENKYGETVMLTPLADM